MGVSKRIRRRSFLLATWLVCWLLGISQNEVIWSVPENPSQQDDVTVFFDASKGNAELAGFAGDVYAHTGVISNRSNSANDWQHVIGNWGTADARVLMKKEQEENIYSISFNIEAFYGIPADEVVSQLAFVFRNINGSLVGRNSDGSDIFLEVAPPDDILIGKLLSPTSQNFVLFLGDSILIEFQLNKHALITIKDNDDVIYSEENDQVSFYFTPMAEIGKQTLTIEANDGSEVTAAMIDYYLMIANEKSEDLPGTINGLNYYSDTTYVFQFSAPGKSYAYLLTTSNDFAPDSAFQMNRSTDDQTFWIELPHRLFANGQNTYQYMVDDGVVIGDPYSTVVLDPWNDAGIDPSIRMTLPPYPREASGIVTVFEPEPVEFDWTDSDFNPPAKSELIIYELLLRDFLASHDYQTLKDTLSYLEKLGVNAIELMPINEFEGNESWGYNPSYHMAVDKYYGTRDQLKTFINEAHKRNIAVILDVVFNHTFSQSPLAQLYWDKEAFRPSPDNPWLNVTARHPFNVGYDFNHESQATKNWVKHILSYWIEEFHFDGFRFDLSKGLTQTNSGTDEALMSRYDPSRVAILGDYAQHIWSIDSSVYVILEHFADNTEERILSDMGMLLWGNMNHEYNEAAMGYSSSLGWGDYTMRGFNQPNLITYLESHDEERLMYKIPRFGNSSGTYNTRILPTALDRMAAASTIFYMIPGPKMLWQFGELGYDFSINRCTDGRVDSGCRLDPKPAGWTLLDAAERRELFDITAALIGLRKKYPTFSSTDFRVNDVDPFVKAVYLNHQELDAIAIANFNVIEEPFRANFPYTGTWYEFFSGDSIMVSDVNLELNLAPGNYRLYTSDQISPSDILTTGSTQIQVWKQAQIFPNPSQPGQVLSVELPADSHVESIIISSLDGIQSHVDFSTNPVGIQFELSSGLPAGMYLVQINVVSGRKYQARLTVLDYPD